MKLNGLTLTLTLVWYGLLSPTDNKESINAALRSLFECVNKKQKNNVM